MSSAGWGTAPEIDGWAVFAATPTPYLLLTPDLVIVGVNQAYLRATSRAREHLVGLHMFEAFPDNPNDPGADGVRNLRASLERARDTGRPDTMPLQKYDIPIRDAGTVHFEERYWSPINTPVLDDTGRTILLIHRVEDVTDYVRERRGNHAEHEPSAALRTRIEAAEEDLFARVRELQEANERLRAAHARERQVALSLQRAMLPPSVAIPGLDVATRYLPATDEVRIGGDWYDVVELGGGRVGVAVGDVMGHRLAAAGMMGQLRSALVAAMHATESPAAALDVLDVYTASLQGQVFATVVLGIIDLRGRRLTYGNAGHPPPLLVCDGTPLFLNLAKTPPLATWLGQPGRPQATEQIPPEATLVLYTDGMIERRDRDIDAGLRRLAQVAGTAAQDGAESLADALVDELLPDGNDDDDVALVVIRF